MPAYAKNYRKRNPRTTYRPNFRRKTFNKPALSIQKKKYVPKTVKNTSSIYTLARQVKQLQVSQIGPYQKRMETILMDTAHVGAGGFSRGRPLAFQMNDFTDDCHLHTVNNTTKDGLPLARTFIPSPSFFSSTDAKYNPLWAMNDCEVSKNRYLPLKAEYKFKITMKMAVTDPVRWMRIDFLTPRKIIPTSEAHTLNLPEGLYSMGYIINGDSGGTLSGNPATNLLHAVAPNKINYTYWKPVQKTKWIKFRPQLSTSDVDIIRHVNCDMTFPNKVINVETDTPYSVAVDTITTNTPRSQAIWAVLSFDKDYGVADDVNVAIGRTIHWRDEHGSAN